MTAKEFNEKWNKHLKPRFYGMSIHDEDVIAYLDSAFEKEVFVNPEFEYSQVKLKFGACRIYSNSENNHNWETSVDEILRNKSDKNSYESRRT